ncbi:MAG: PAAR domain-containing protein [Marivita sp.]|uniref:PAAR domain-containing protein n=1 Tax=Marivita sp. TaxID=2003365 RepID=UPI003EF6E601
MPPAHRLSDMSSGHKCIVCNVFFHPPMPVVQGSPNVSANTLAVMRVGDMYAPHFCPVCKAPHPQLLAAGSRSVFVNGIPAGRIGDRVACGGQAQSGSPNVVIGG